MVDKKSKSTPKQPGPSGVVELSEEELSEAQGGQGHFRNVEGLDGETQAPAFQDGEDIILRKRSGKLNLRT